MAAALILIDIQTGFETPGWGARITPNAEAIHNSAVSRLHREFVEAVSSDHLLRAAP